MDNDPRLPKLIFHEDSASYRIHPTPRTSFDELQCSDRYKTPCPVDDQIQRLLKKLLATEDPAEFEVLSHDLKAALHERIEKLRKDARGLNSKGVDRDRRKRPRNGKNKP